MKMALGAAVWAFSSVVLAQNTGPAPVTGVGALDIFSAFKLPSFPDDSGSPLESAVLGLQAGHRAKLLGLSRESPVDAWKGAQSLLTPAPAPRIRNTDAARPGAVMFSGTTASDLNQLLSRTEVFHVVVTSAAIEMDQPIELQRAGFVLDLASAQLTGVNARPYMFRIENASDVIVRGGSFTSGSSAILIHDSNRVSITGAQIRDLEGAGIVVTGSSHVTIRGNQISGVHLAAITLHRGTSQSIVEHNQITGGLGFSNMMAGIVLTDREVDMASDPRAVLGPDGYWVVSEPMAQRLHPPHDNLIAWNDVNRNSASGIYSDGGVRNVIDANTITGNSKEGLCLDNGSAANVVASNHMESNGTRWGEPDSVLALDSVLSGGRLSDGAAAEKLPGISLDNAIYNIVFDNNLAHNSGGGIKMVRTGYFNAVGVNTLVDDNDGASASFHYFGIELGAAAGDGSSIELDFTPSRGNLLFSNTIRGTHYSGIFFGAGSDRNNVFDNTILDATAWALESTSQMANTTLNNYTNLPSRNIGSGLDPALLVIGQPVDDPP